MLRYPSSIAAVKLLKQVTKKNIYAEMLENSVYSPKNTSRKMEKDFRATIQIIDYYKTFFHKLEFPGNIYYSIFKINELSLYPFAS